MTDTDRKIERLYRMSVSEIFEKMGEEAFRDMETHCLDKLLEEPQGQIIAVGGGPQQGTFETAWMGCLP